MTARNRALFLERGHAYVYLAYGRSLMLNVSSEASGVGAGVLIRAIEPTDGIEPMKQNRGTERVRYLAPGPARLCAALAIDRRLDGIDLCQVGPLWLGSDGQASDEIGQSKRIGITRAADSLLRFYVRAIGSSAVTALLEKLPMPGPLPGFPLEAAERAPEAKPGSASKRRPSPLEVFL
jgi:DNA-3-methyladenine glycosylase